MATETFYTTQGDGTIRHTFATSWANARDFTGGAVDIGETMHGEYDTGINFYNLSRTYFGIDTSGLPDDITITAASVFVKPKNGTINNTEATYPADICLVANSRVSQTSLDTDITDWAAVGDTKLSDTVVDLVDWGAAGTAGNFVEFELNAAGIAAISVDGYSCFALRTLNDLENNTPTANSSSEAIWSTALSASDTDKAKITITYTLASNIKSINGLALADVKSINGLAIADVKSYNGLE